MSANRYTHIPLGEDGWPTAAGARLAGHLIRTAARLGPEFPDDPSIPRHPVTLGYWEQRKEWRAPKRGGGEPKWFVVPGQYVRTVRTMEFFDEETTDASETTFVGMDRCPRDDENWLKHGPPRIRRVRADRITDVTVHKRSAYRLKNQYFIDQVRKHAEEQRRPRLKAVARLTDDAIWTMIQLATDTDDAIRRAGLPPRPPKEKQRQT